MGVSVSYLSQIEADQRPLTTRVLLALVAAFDQPASYFDVDDDQRLAADLRAALAEGPSADLKVGAGEIQRAAVQTPTLARRYLDLLGAYQQLDERLRLTEQAVSLDERSSASSRLPYEEVRDFFHHMDNHIPALDMAAEALAGGLAIPSNGDVGATLANRLSARWGVTLAQHSDGGLLRRFDPLRRGLSLRAGAPAATRNFQMACQLVGLEFEDEIEAELGRASFRTAATADVCRVALHNYAAGALLMPYEAFRAAAAAARHDIERLAVIFQCSLEQAAHRLSTLQRPGRRGLPFYFVRLDAAGNITKRHSATRLRFARFGGSCPLWNVHDVAAVPERFLVQIAEMPDGGRYLSVARSIVKPSGAFAEPHRRYVIGFGCELEHAAQLVYADSLDRTAVATPIGVSCRICERDGCAHRAFPPVDRELAVPRNERRVTPFRLI